MMKTGIFYGSTTGNTENAAELIGKLIENSDIQSIADTKKDDLEKYDLLILGTSTWGWGELQ
jgi:flavodoxin I